MTQRMRQDWLFWLLIVGALFALIGPIRLLSDIGQPFGGYITFQRAATPYNEVDGNTPAWWSGLTEGELNHSDLLVTSDGQPHSSEARQIYEAAFTSGAATVSLGFMQDGVNKTDEVPVRIFTLLDFLDLRLPDLITGFVLWLAGIIVYTARPDQPANRAFAFATAVAGYGRIMYVHTVFFDRMSVGSELQLQLWISLLGPAMFLLAARFPYPSTKKLVQPILILSGVLGIVAFGLALYSRIESMPNTSRIVAGEIAYNLTIILLYASIVALFWRLIYWFITSRNSKRDRRIAGILIVGWALTLPPIIASGLNALQIGDGSSYYFFYGLDLRYMFLFAPLAFAFVLVRYNAMQAPSPLFIFLMVVTTSAIAAALLAWVWFLTHSVLEDADNGPPFLSLFLAALGVGVFWTSIARLPHLLGRTLSWDRFSTASAREFGRRVSANMDLGRTPETIAQAAVDEFELDQCAVWLMSPSGTELRLAAHTGIHKTDLPAVVSLDGKALPSTTYPFRPALVKEKDAPWGPDSPESARIDVVVPLAMEGRVLGVMGLGPRWDEDVFDSRNLDIFEIVGQQATLLLDVTQHVQELQRVPGKLVDAQELERMRLAQELHDTVQQFLGRLPFYLAVSRDSFKTNPKKATELIDRSIADVEEAAQAVRQIRLNLAPSQLERGLTQALLTLTSSFQKRTGIITTLSFDSRIDSFTNRETRLAIYRVVQQALDNVETHAKATRVSMQATIDEDKVCFSIVDNGKGSSEAERQAAKAKGSFGMESMSARLAASGGGLTVVSSSGNGLEVNGWAPVHTEPQVPDKNDSDHPASPNGTPNTSPTAVISLELGENP